jgi:hypothetical protein
MGWIAAATPAGAESLPSAELAKKCSALTAKAFPPRQLGNPAAGSKKGDAQVQRDYFRKCIANQGGNSEPH